VKLQEWTSTRSSNKWDPRATRGPSVAAARRRGVATSPVVKGATSGGAAASAVNKRAPREADASLSTRSMLSMGRGANIATTRGEGAAMAPLGAGYQRIKAVEALGAVRFSSRCAGATRRRGAPATAYPTAGTFGLFLLRREHPRCFLPATDEQAAAEAEEESMASGFFLLPSQRSSTGIKWK
jgi:hypothetical protein